MVILALELCSTGPLPALKGPLSSNRIYRQFLKLNNDNCKIISGYRFMVIKSDKLGLKLFSYWGDEFDI